MAKDRKLSRRQFFRNSLLSIQETLAEVVEKQMDRLEHATRALPDEAPPPVPAPHNQAPSGRSVVRPPGALPEIEFLATCERCRKCVDVCHLFCIIPSQPGMAAELGTPYLLPETAPCDFCHECVEVCPSGALQPFDPENVKIGTAVIDTYHCILSQGEICDLCYQACPKQDAAIEIPPDGFPLIHAEACTGCGFCGEACPAPSRAITVFPV